METKLLNNQWVGIISVLISSIFFGLWYNFSARADYFESLTNHQFYNGLGQSEIDTYKLYSHVFFILGILFVVLGGYVIRNNYLRSKVKN